MVAKLVTDIPGGFTATALAVHRRASRQGGDRVVSGMGGARLGALIALCAALVMVGGHGRRAFAAAEADPVAAAQLPVAVAAVVEAGLPPAAAAELVRALAAGGLDAGDQMEVLRYAPAWYANAPSFAARQRASAPLEFLREQRRDGAEGHRLAAAVRGELHKLGIPAGLGRWAPAPPASHARFVWRPGPDFEQRGLAIGDGAPSPRRWRLRSPSLLFDRPDHRSRGAQPRQDAPVQPTRGRRVDRWT